MEFEGDDQPVLVLPVLFVAIGHEVFVVGNQQLRFANQGGVEDRVVLAVCRQDRDVGRVEGRRGDDADGLQLTS